MAVFIKIPLNYAWDYPVQKLLLEEIDPSYCDALLDTASVCIKFELPNCFQYRLAEFRGCTQQTIYNY